MAYDRGQANHRQVHTTALRQLQNIETCTEADCGSLLATKKCNNLNPSFSHSAITT